MRPTPSRATPSSPAKDPKECWKPIRAGLVKGPDGKKCQRFTAADSVAIKVFYPEAVGSVEGWIYFGKARLTPDTPAVVLDYAHIDPAFPSNSTIDQFLDPKQFAAYVGLGHHVAANVLALDAEAR